MDRLSLRGIRFIEGASEGAAGSAPTPTAETTSGQAPAGNSAPVEPGNLDVETANKETAKARAEAAKYRTAKTAAEAEAAKTSKALADITKLLGGGSDETPTPEQLTQAIQERDAALATATEAQAAQARENAVLRAAPGLNANGDSLLDSRAFTATLAEVDPSDKDAIKTAITTALAANPAHALTRVSGSSGPGAGGGEQKTTPKTTLLSAVSARLGG
ncbi:hypothetical protein [Mycetocola spongiae]|uniref:hypothetical protein n=1 Tax=Mycetocola spongiae TaxID=2859226 RepID=UPI001CF181A0|nr:hypothetical protein [Mycetocola spongiae]UCR89254.1 hypothetical protein KXZ72_00630 [Mycetocola spongiae]